MAGDTKVTRIKAKDAPKGAASKRKQSTQSTQRTAEKPRRSNKGNQFAKMLRGIGGYFKGAWQELKQVRWPTRRATWELTLAVLLFTAFFTGIIVLLDLLFGYLFELIIN